MIGGVLAYLAWGAWLASRMDWTDGEYGLLPAGAVIQVRRYRAEFGTAPPLVGGVARLPFRLPGAYWLYAWAPYVAWRHQRPFGRALSLAVSAVGVGVTLVWAQELAGPWAVAWAALILCSLASVTGAYATASYEGAVATLWMGGLYAAYHEAPMLALCCGVTLALVRASALPQAVALWVLSYPLLAPLALGALLLSWPRDVIMANGWVRLFYGENAVPFMPRDGWAYGLRVLGQRYEPALGWALLVWAAGWPRYPGPDLLGITTAALFFAHAPRALIRPKWVAGYLPDFALPVILVAAVQITSLPVTWWSAAGVAMTAAWGLMRPRHPAIPA